MRSALVRVLAAVVTTVAIAVAGTGASSAAAPPVEADAGRQRLIVTLPVAGTTAAPESRAAESQRATIARRSDAVVDVVEDRGGRITRTYRAFPFVAVEADAATVDALARRGAITGAVVDVPMPIADAESTPLVGATTAHGGGFDGTGQSVAILDTGVDRSHPFLAGKVVDEACFAYTATCPNGTTVQRGDGAGVPCTFAPGDCAHGTHVAGIAAGGPEPNAPFTGVAPGAGLVSIQVFSRFTDPVCSVVGKPSPCALALNSEILAGLEHVYEHADELSVASVNISIGSFPATAPCDGNVLKPAIDALRAIGVATVVSAGNDGRTDALSQPACISSAISVGATTKTDGIASYTNSARFLSLWAPGSSIRSSVPGGGYANYNGTSMAAPHVAGAFALARELLPDASVGEILRRFVLAGPRITDHRNGLAFSRLDVAAALGVVQVVPGSGAARAEGEQVRIPVRLSRPSTLPVTVRYRTHSFSASDGTDYASTSGTLTFPPGRDAAEVVVETLTDATVEGGELFLVQFGAPTNATMGGYWGLGIGGITDGP